MKKKQKIKKKIKWKVILKILFLFFVVGLSIYYLKNLQTKSIIISGNNYVSDHEIIVSSGFKNYPKLFLKSKSEIENSILSIPFVDSVKIKRSLTGTLKIEIVEAPPLFFYQSNNKLVLENKKEINYPESNGVPTLTNFVPEEFLEKLIEKFKNVDKNVRGLISEIEYLPWKSNNVMIDETRFILKMNDGNTVYVNLIHMDKLNNYIEIFSSLEGKLGTLYLDSSSDKISFSEYKVGD